MYISTGRYLSAFSLETSSLSFLLSIYLKKYHDDPAHCGIVFVSRFAGFPQQGQVVLTHSSIAASGDSPVPVGSYDSTSGNNNGN